MTQLSNTSSGPIAPTPRSARQARQAADKRERILEAATRVFARAGYHGSRVSDIAREAGIAYGLVYHYFKNKEEILDTIFSERWGGFVAVVESIAAGDGSTEEKLLAVAERILDAYHLRETWVKVLVFEIQRSSRFAEPEQIRAVGRLFQAISRILRAGQASGELRADIDCEVASYVFIGGLDVVVTSRVLKLIRVEGGVQGERAYAREVARNVLEIFLRGLGCGAPAAGRRA